MGSPRWEVESHGDPGTDLEGGLLGRRNGKGGEKQARAKVGHWAERKLVRRTGDKRPNLEVVSEELTTGAAAWHWDGE